jgi:hypothetical protein
MDWIIAISEEDRRRGLSPDTVRRACKAFQQHGCVILRGAVSNAAIDGLYRDFMANEVHSDLDGMRARAASPPPNGCLEVGDSRFEITVPMVGPFADPGVFANPILGSVLHPLLGQGFRLSSFTAVVSYPGALLQHIHRDHPQLFDHTELGPTLPAYAVNVAVPLIDVDAITGPTGVWPGSHRWSPAQPAPDPASVTVVPFLRGDCVLLDYRTLHSGMPNQSTQIRPIVYMVYARHWFFDEINHRERVPLDMSPATYATLPDNLKPLLTRAHSQVMRARQISRAYA